MKTLCYILGHTYKVKSNLFGVAEMTCTKCKDDFIQTKNGFFHVSEMTKQEVETIKHEAISGNEYFKNKLGII